MDTFGLDLRYALRGLARSPGFTAVAVGSLALAIGVNSTIFGLVNAVLIRPLPVAEPDRLVRIGRTLAGGGFGVLSYPEIQAIGASATSFEGVLGHQMRSVALDVGGEPTEEMIEVVTSGYFEVLGVTPSVGRTLRDAGAVGGASAEIVVVSDRFWRSRLQARADVVGAVLRINGRPFTVVGVAPEGFGGTFAGFEIDLWVPLAARHAVLEAGIDPTRVDERFLMAMGRLEPGSTEEAAQAEVEAVLAGLTGAEPDAVGRIRVVGASGIHPDIAGLVRGFLALLMVVVGLVLLIACANVANLLLARSAARRPELAIRVSIGAGRWRLLRQLLTESLLLGLLGGAAGALVAFQGAGLLTRLRPPVDVPLGLDVGVDVTVLAFTACVSLATALLFGLAPAVVASRADPIRLLRGGSTGLARGGWARSGIVVAQVATCAFLLFGAGLLARGLQRSRALDPGFDAEQVLVASADPSLLGYEPGRVMAFWDEVDDRLSVLPGVQSASVALFVPLGDRSDRFRISADPAPEWPRVTPVDYNVVRPGFFETVGIALLAGRDVADSDDASSPPVAVVNEALADRYFDGEALGRVLRVQEPSGEVRAARIVGIVATTGVRSLGEAPRPHFYMPHAQFYRPDAVAHVRTSRPADEVAGAVREVMRSVDDRVPVHVRPMREAMAFSLAPSRIIGAVLGVAGLLGLALAVTGVFGVVSYGTRSRSREMGIRAAIGAAPETIRVLVLRDGLRLVGGGLLLGLAAAALAAPALSGFLFGVSPRDPATLLTVSSVLLGTGLAAAYLPARAATRVDPVEVLRAE